ncbi:hypothetical protein ACIRQH_24200 [Streptomyces sp. NPDC102279]|uniref:hypothetical protein n=1 Tax=Streptomyces sp. NPDC102279 TaxID=3366153 RepID=UPI003818D561
MAYEWQQAELLDNTGIRVTAVVHHVVPAAGHGQPVRADMVYALAGHRHSTRKVLNGGYPLPRKGDRVCLEASGEQPRLVRLCGDRYPDGDDRFPTLALTGVAATIGLIYVIARWVAKNRELLQPRAKTASPG